MSEHAHAHSDNQFVAGRPLKPRPQFTRRDYSSTLFNRDRPSSVVEIKTHRSHRPLISHDFFKGMLEATEPKHRFKIPKLTKLQYSLLSLALVVLITGGYFGISGLQAVNTANVQAFKLTSLANQANKSTASVGSTKNPALSTTPISASTLADYSVAPNLPRYLIIPKLNVDARILSVGVTSTGAVGTPDNIYDTAWYNESAEPGQPGATLIDGHVSSWTAHGVFYGIKTLVAGDTIQVERGDGTMYTYKVVSSQVYPSGNVNMQAAITPVVSGQPGLNLITCAGDVIPGTNSFSERIIVFATQVSPSP